MYIYGTFLLSPLNLAIMKILEKYIIKYINIIYWYVYTVIAGTLCLVFGMLLDVYNLTNLQIAKMIIALNFSYHKYYGHRQQQCDDFMLT